jgi:hypothetical protein
VGRAHVRHPVAHRLVDGVFEGAAAGVDADHLGAEQPHALDVDRLAPHVLGAHVDDAFEAEERRRRRRRHTVLPGAGLGDDARLLHALGEQALAEGVVELVGAGVQQVLALEEDARAAEVTRQPVGEPQRRRTAGVVAQQLAQPGAEDFVARRPVVGARQLGHRRHQRLGHEAAAEFAEAAGAIGPLRATSQHREPPPSAASSSQHP